MKIKINNVNVYVRHLERAAKWYSKHLGFTIHPHENDIGVELHIDGKCVMNLIENEIGVPMKAGFALETDNIDDAYHTLSSNGIEVSSIDDNGDNKSFSFKDCEGNSLILTQWVTNSTNSKENETDERKPLMDNLIVSAESRLMHPIVNQNITVVFVCATDLETASKWYCDTFGFTLGEHDFNSYVELFFNGQYVMNIMRTNKPYHYAIPHFSFSCSDIDSLYRILNDNHIEVLDVNSINKRKAFLFKDCSGNVLQVIESQI